MLQANKQVAIVTGGGSGIGLAIAAKYVGQGIHTIIIGRDNDKLEKARQELGTLCYPIVHDLSDLSSIPALINNIMTTHGQIDILVNNAGINMKKDFITTTDEDFQQIIHTNLIAVFVLSREVIKQMQLRKSGCIIHISSMAAQYGMPRVIAYSASKSAIDGMTRAMAVELSGQGIRINAIAPGFIETAMTATALNSDPERKQKALSRTPMGHMGKPENIADAALFLASDSAAYITGVILPVDGGNSIGF
ncbi:NAD(P)-dependent dehydrogenase (short-subunit alcohol dehydrogenase family) [Chitinophaga dinghuensis]|uniref:NAD(P)-dependent dehydrogenase (Short-subunit alcohol dehydrogenase family) n=1 Tax=Chitinophaga dinghuensis TaxID=1539050 RepID=A0A327W2B8_9BACT|nr:SDR family oxidoreductase [Chitinophaga dinghuensis]RAJ79078.1 NAD(P)-dependent dehydrogenase (short-subunit alcohol dehydrogenase family) [Chitinophaga dinghuensis]